MSTKPALLASLLLPALLALPRPATGADAGLAAALRKALNDKPPKGAQPGVHVVDLATGETVFAHEPDVAANPASCIKLVTTAAALDHFGPGHVFYTDVVAPVPRNGVVTGDVVLQGSGDPGLRTAHLWRLAHLVAAAGVRKVTGGVVLDHGLFDGKHTPPLFDTKDSDHAFRAQVCAGGVDWGTLQVRVWSHDKLGMPPLVTVDPPGAPVELDNGALIKKGKSRLIVGSVPLPGRDKVVVRGTVPPDGKLRTVLRRSEFPGRTAAAAFATLLEGEGVELAKPPRFGPTPEGVVRLATHGSPPLAQQVAYLNQWSNNYMAETLLKALGADVYGKPGTSDKGLRALGRFLDRLGVERAAYTLGNGSGLYDANRFTPAAMTRVLVAMYGRADLWPDYVASLAVGGRPGTLEHRLRERAIAGRVRAKTGTLADAVALSGYVRSAEGRDYAFSVLISQVRGAWAARRLADRLARTVATWKGEQGAEK